MQSRRSPATFVKHLIISELLITLRKTTSLEQHLLRHGRKGDARLGAAFAGYGEPGIADIEGAFLLNQFASGLTQVPWVHASAEFYSVKAPVHNKVGLESLLEQGKATLCHDFTENHARHNGIARKMALTVKRVLRDCILSVAYALIVKSHLVNKEHGLPVRKVIHDFLAVHLVVLMIAFCVFLEELQAGHAVQFGHETG